VGHLLGGELAEFGIDQGQQFLSGLGFALLRAVEDARDVAHSWSIRQVVACVDSDGPPRQRIRVNLSQAL